MRYLLILFLIINACRNNNTINFPDPLPSTTPTPAPTPVPSPTPTPAPDCTITQTLIRASVNGIPVQTGWSYRHDAVLKAKFVFASEGCGDDAATVAWVLKPIGLCDTFGNILDDKVTVSCLRPGTLDVTAVPVNPKAPIGRAQYDIKT